MNAKPKSNGKATKKAKPKSATTFIDEEVIRDPAVTPEALRQAVRDAGHEKTKDATIDAYRVWTRQFIGIATRLGKWKT